MDLHGSIENIAKRNSVRIGLTLKSLQNKRKSVYGVSLILYHLGNSGESIDEALQAGYRA
jgi:hypothetical protein